MVSVAGKHSEPIVRDCQNNSVQAVADTSVVSQSHKRMDAFIDDDLNLCYSEADTEDECNGSNNNKSKETNSSILVYHILYILIHQYA